MSKKICVFCSSSSTVPDVYVKATQELGQWIGRNGHTLIYGGSTAGMMGQLSAAVRQSGGQCIGVIPDFLQAAGLANIEDNETIITDSMHLRKAKMIALADVFIALPGGYGTLEEILEVITLKQLQQHNKPIYLYNTNGFYDILLQLSERLIVEQFIKEVFRGLFDVVETCDNLEKMLAHYVVPVYPRKW